MGDSFQIAMLIFAVSAGGAMNTMDGQEKWSHMDRIWRGEEPAQHPLIR